MTDDKKNVLSLIPRVPASLDNASCADWLAAYAEAIRDSAVDMRNVVLLIEGKDGTLSKYSTGLPIDTTRLAGLFSAASLWTITGQMDDILEVRDDNG